MASAHGGAMEYRIRPCAASDCPQLLGMIRALAEFEEMPEQVAIGVPELMAGGFSGTPLYRCLVAEGPAPAGGPASTWRTCTSPPHTAVGTPASG
ncbi:thialysine N-epsilon-acetyltransferase [Haliaeetus albicilla]|uniref:thialysine N-epsilon-acetyltransferase n=1 Tax=Haliaeetus albicilla TaxID=8969 RepID=UPI0037E7CE14